FIATETIGLPFAWTPSAARSRLIRNGRAREAGARRCGPAHAGAWDFGPRFDRLATVERIRLFRSDGTEAREFESRRTRTQQPAMWQHSSLTPAGERGDRRRPSPWAVRDAFDR